MSWYALSPEIFWTTIKPNFGKKFPPFFGGFLTYFDLADGGCAFGIQKQQQQSEEQDIVGVTVFSEYDPLSKKQRWCKSRILDKLAQHFVAIRAYMSMKSDPLGVPEVLLRDPAAKKHFDEAVGELNGFFQPIQDWHLEYGPQEKHLYIGIIATDPEQQGAGFGLRMMTLLGQAADEVGLACYLECPDHNRKFYEKCGYRLAKRIPANEMCVRVGTGLCLMVRPANKAP